MKPAKSIMALRPQCKCGIHGWFKGDRYHKIVSEMAAAGWKTKHLEKHKTKYICRKCSIGNTGIIPPESSRNVQLKPAGTLSDPPAPPGRLF